MIIRESEYTITTKSDITDSLIAHISDLHYSEKTRKEKLEAIKSHLLLNKRYKPNYICINGDLLAGSNYYDNILIHFIKEFAEYCPVIITFGNKELMCEGFETSDNPYNLQWIEHINPMFFEELKKIPNVFVLGELPGYKNFNRNFHDKERNINIVGLNLNFDYYEKFKENPEVMFNILKEYQVPYVENAANILQLHTPYNIGDYHFLKQLENFSKFDGMMFGHMHNGSLPYIAEPFFTAFMALPFLIYSINKYGIIDGFNYASKYLKTLGFIGVHNDLFPICSKECITIDDIDLIFSRPLTMLSEAFGKKAKIINSSLVAPPAISFINVLSEQKHDYGKRYK